LSHSESEEGLRDEGEILARKNTPRINEVMGNLEVLKAKEEENNPIMSCVV